MGATCSACDHSSTLIDGEPMGGAGGPSAEAAGCGDDAAAAGPTLLGRTHLQDPHGAKKGGAASPPNLPAARPPAEPAGSDGAGADREAPASPLCSEASTPTGYTNPIATSVNTVLEHLWPRISKYATEVIVKEVQPALVEQLPAALKSLSFDPELCHLGEKPLEFRRIQIIRDDQETALGDVHNLVFRASIDWDADCSVYLKYAGAGLGIRGLRVRGVLLFEMVGLMDQPPFFEGVRVFFNNRPFVDVDFQGTGEGLLNLGLIRQKILDVVADGISDEMVLPHRIGFKLRPEADIFNIKCPPPHGILTLTVWSAAGLLAKDVSCLRRPTSDPYVVVKCGAYRFQSPTKYKTLSPEFAWKVVVPVTELANQRVLLELFDEDLMNHDDFLGRLSVSAQCCVRWGKDNRVVLELEDEDKQKGKCGSVTVSAAWEALAIDAAGDHFELPGLISVGIDTASKLTRAGEGTKYWVKVVCNNPLPGFPEAATETKRVAEDAPELPAETQEGNIVGAHSMKRRLAILQKHGLGEDEMAEVLDVDAKVLRSSLLMRCETQAAGSLLASSRSSTYDAKFEHGLEFPVERVADSVLKFALMRKLCHHCCEEVVGEYEFPASKLRGARNATLWRNIEFPETPARLRVKLSMRYFDPSAGDAIAPGTLP
mmetsp:Transcript_111815/g.323161  ORF Transcript_111815/g.323161 Transcript_111815/m.323161 type:complete len:657 (+) Transcript_111815:92-2062(+)